MRIITLKDKGGSGVGVFVFRNDNLAEGVYRSAAHGDFGQAHVHMAAVDWTDVSQDPRDLSLVDVNAAIRKVVDERRDENASSHIMESLECTRCSHEWIDVRPLGTVVFQCPNCGADSDYILRPE